MPRPMLWRAAPAPCTALVLCHRLSTCTRSKTSSVVCAVCLCTIHTDDVRVLIHERWPAPPTEREQELATLKEYVALLLTKIIDQCPAILEDLSRTPS